MASDAAGRLTGNPPSPRCYIDMPCLACGHDAYCHGNVSDTKTPENPEVRDGCDHCPCALGRFDVHAIRAERARRPAVTKSTGGAS